LSKNDSFQIASFAQQRSINEQQLKAITKQANTAEAQFNLQSLQSADLYERNKAIFVPDTATITKVSLTISTISFRIMNVGNLWAHVDSSYVAVYNSKYLYFVAHTTITSTDLGQFGNYKTGGIPVFSPYLSLDDTYYCLLVYYYDSADRKEKSVPKFFRYTYNSKKEFVLLPVDALNINLFSNEILKQSKYKRF